MRAGRPPDANALITPILPQAETANMTETEYNVLPWAQPDLLDDASAWIREQLGRHGWSETGALEVVHQRPWSTLARVNKYSGNRKTTAPV